MLDTAQFMALKASGDLPSPRGPALKVIQLCQRDNVPLPEIARVLQIDPMMVGRILKLANSSAFGRQRTAMALTPDVLMSIGIQSIRQVVLAFSLVSENRKGQCSGFDYEMFWSHSAAAGVATQLISAVTRVAPAADLFTVGLLADVGQLALATLLPDRYGELLARAGGQFSTALTTVESAEFGFTHLDLSAAMMKDWGLPRLFTDAVLFHETLELAGFDAGSRSEKVLKCVHLGVRLADICFTPVSAHGEEFRRLLPLALTLGIADDALAVLGDQTLREWVEWGALLEISVHKVAPFSSLNAAA